MDTPTSLGLWLRQRRRALDLTQEELARCAGCSLSAIRKIETDERRPSRQVAELLADCLQIPPEERPTFLKIARSELRVDRLSELAPVPRLSPQPELGTPAPLPSRSSAPLPPRTPAPRHNLPIPPTPLLGREPELASLARLLQNPHCRLVTLTGPGGIGKTRLAIATAAEQAETFPDGVYFVPLAPLNAPEFIVPTIAEAIGFAFYGPMAPKTQLLNYLRQKEMLLVLDNLEHLLAGVGWLADVLQHAPGVKLLVTSRERLNLQGEWVFEIHGLPVPPPEQVGELEAYSAAALFLQSAQRGHVDFVLTTEERPAIARICQLVEGMPLGIELAAAWVRVLSCREIAQEIERNLDFLAASGRDVPARHHSIRAVFDHSWKLLSGEEQRVLRQLSVFRGGFRREAAEHMVGATLPLLSALVDKSLLHRTEARRYSLHELVQQYADAKLRELPEEHARIRDLHYSHYATLLQQREAALKNANQQAAIKELSAEIDNLRLVWNWAITGHKTTDIRRTAFILGWFFELRGWFQEAETTFRAAADEWQKGGVNMEALGEENNITLGHLLGLQGWFCFRIGQAQQAMSLLHRSLTLLRSYSDHTLLFYTLVWLGLVTHLTGGNIQEVRHLLQESLTIAEALRDRWSMALALATLGIVAYAEGEHREAHSLLRRSLEAARAVGDPRRLVVSLSYLGAAAHAIGEYAEARQMLRESLAISRVTGDRWGMMLALTNLGDATYALGTYPEAWQAFREALQTAIEAQAIPIAMEALVGLASLMAKDGATEQAVEWSVHILQHPANAKKAKDRAERLRAELESQLTPQQLETIQACVQAKTFEAVVAEILATYSE
jgi:predicted ATPase/transcriptional regulator with XRE-family HTH domain